MEHFSPRHCTILLVMSRWVDHPLSAETLVIRLLSDPSSIKSFTDGLIDRGKLLPKLKQKGVAQSSVNEHVNVVAVIVNSFVKLSPAVTQHLRTSRFLDEWTRIVLDLEQSLRAYEIVLLCCRLLILTTTPIEHPLRSVALLAPVVMPIFARNLPNAKIDGNLELMVTASLKTALESRLLFPRGIRALRSAMDDFDPSGTKMGRSKLPSWTAFIRGVKEQGDFLSNSSLEELGICDSIAVSRPLSTRITAQSVVFFHLQPSLQHDVYDTEITMGAQCSGCHSVVYCSLQCQREDWNERHRTECLAMLRSYEASKRDNTHISHQTRAFHIYIAKASHSGFNLWEARREQEHPGVPHNELVARMNFGLPNPHLFHRIDDIRPGSQARPICPAWNARREGMVSDFRRSNDTQRRLIDWNFSWNVEYQISLLTEFQLLEFEDGPAEWVLARHASTGERFSLKDAQADAAKMDHNVARALLGISR
ncbi:hypothetical protein CC2G_009783 [Coprinopsis cinerea AmutBmut pab1-1]|nr:hypothetical protein CC2G_009783 [Coprinopsis cinerea AmutBmut pab1-1]